MYLKSFGGGSPFHYLCTQRPKRKDIKVIEQDLNTTVQPSRKTINYYTVSHYDPLLMENVLPNSKELLIMPYFLPAFNHIIPYLFY